MGIDKKAAIAALVIAVALSMGVTATYAQTTIPTPSVPTFSLKFIDESYDVPATTFSTTNPYTNQTTTTIIPSRHVENKTIEITINNQEFNQSLSNLYYNIRFKGHFAENWTSQLAFLPSNSSGSAESYVANELVQSQTNASVTIVDYPASSAIFPAGGEADFQVEAVLGSVVTTYDYSHIVPIQQSTFLFSSGDWSSTQTVSMPANPPTAPTIILAALIVAAVAVGLLIYIAKRRIMKQ